MKLFLSTLFFFIGVVFFQSTLTFFLVKGVVTNNNEVAARGEIEIEANAVYENYNLWVRILWRTLIRINKDEKYKALVDDTQLFYSENILGDWFEEILLLSGVDLIVLKKQTNDKNEFILSGNISFADKNLDGLEARKDHPYIELREIDGDVYLIGTFKYGNTESFEFFIFKRIDEKFYRNLPLQERSVVFLASYSDLGSGLFLGDNNFNKYLTPAFLDVPYKEVYNLELEEGSFNAAFQNLGKLQRGNSEEDFFLILLISNEPHLSMLSIISKTLLSVSLIVALFTIILSFYFSGKITKPISMLIKAMEGIREGFYNVKIDYKSGNEVGKLFQGFNDMAMQLNQNKTTMEEFIHEITFLKDYNEKIIHSLQAGIVVLSSNLSVEKVNSIFLDCFKKDESNILGKNIEDISIEVIDKTVIKNIIKVLTEEISSWSEIKRTESLVYEIKLYPLFEFDISNREDRRCVLEIDDVSRKYELEGKIFQAEKLASLSILSAGVSHEINNPLSSILTNVQNLLAGEFDEETGIALNWIEQETRRIAKIVSELLDFSASETENLGGVDINACISDVLRLINYGLDREKRIEIITDFSSLLPQAVISSSELKQIIINLVQNSIHAITGSGKIYIETSYNAEKRDISICIRDSGIGMDNESLLHMFDPFYTTKIDGKGTGLGLSIVYGIINKYNGTIDVKSKKRSGTTIVLVIPEYGNDNWET